jgi:hypothetical protein
MLCTLNSSTQYFPLTHSVLFTHLITFYSFALYFPLNHSVHFTQLLSTFTNSLNTFHNSSAQYFFLFICSVLSTYPLSTSCHQIRTFHSSANILSLIRSVLYTTYSPSIFHSSAHYFHSSAHSDQDFHSCTRFSTPNSSLFSLFLAVIHRLHWCFTFSAQCIQSSAQFTLNTFYSFLLSLYAHHFYNVQLSRSVNFILTL